MVAQGYVILKKHEIRNSKSETISNVQNTNDQNENSRLRRRIAFVLNFEFLDFEFVSNCRVEPSVTLRLPHRPGRAQLTHPVPHVMALLRDILSELL
jgi:hypothetical protein